MSRINSRRIENDAKNKKKILITKLRSIVPHNKNKFYRPQDSNSEIEEVNKIIRKKKQAIE